MGKMKRIECKKFKFIECDSGQYIMQYVNRFGSEWNFVAANMTEAIKWVWSVADTNREAVDAEQAIKDLRCKNF